MTCLKREEQRSRHLHHQFHLKERQQSPLRHSRCLALRERPGDPGSTLFRSGSASTRQSSGLSLAVIDAVQIGAHFGGAWSDELLHGVECRTSVPDWSHVQSVVDVAMPQLFADAESAGPGFYILLEPGFRPTAEPSCDVGRFNGPERAKVCSYVITDGSRVDLGA